MEWIRIKPQHILFSDFTDVQLSALIKFQCLIAQLERIPTEKEMAKVISGHALTSLKSTLNQSGTELRLIADKVMEDVKNYQQKKAKAKEKMARHREKQEDVTRNVASNVTGYVTSNVTDIEKSRLDKIREDESITPYESPNSLEYLFKQWKSKNPLESKNKKIRDAAEAHISAALNRGIKAQEIEKLIWETSGKGIMPWELFKQNKDKSIEAIQNVNRIIEQYQGG